MLPSSFLTTVLVLAAACFTGAAAQGTAPKFASHRQLNDTLVAQFNRGAFAASEAYASPALRQLEAPGSMGRYLAGLQAKTGRIVATAPLGEQGPRHVFEWRGEKQNLRVTLVSAVPGQLDDYFFSDFIAQPTAARPTPASTDNRRKTALDQAVDHAAALYMQHPDAVGLSIGIYQQGKPYFYNYGEVRKGSGQLPTATTYYDMGSVAKTFVSTLLAQAVLEKRVLLTDDIRKYLPGEYPNLEFEGQPVRLMDLANHTSGIPGTPHRYSKAKTDSVRSLRLAPRVAFSNRYTADSLLHDMHYFKLTTRPGTAYRYNNLGPLVLQLLLERIYQQPYEQLVTRYVQTHFGMRDTKRVLSAKEQQRFALGYDEKQGEQAHQNFIGYTGGTTLSSTPADLLRYVQANLKEQDPAVRLTHQRTCGTAPGPQLGLGWMLDTAPAGSSRIFHNGHSIGYNTRCAFYPAQQQGIVILVNEGISQTRVTELEEMIWQELAALSGPAQ